MVQGWLRGDLDAGGGHSTRSSTPSTSCKDRQHPVAVPILRGLLTDARTIRDPLNLGMAESDLGKLDDAITHLGVPSS